MMGLSDSERISMICSAVLPQSKRVTGDRWNCRSIQRAQHGVTLYKLWPWSLLFRHWHL